jgi:hypothetical protein
MVTTHGKAYSAAINAAVIAASAALVLTLAGCDPTPAPISTGTPDAKPVESVTPTPEPAPVVEPLTIPGCEALLPIALAQSSFGESTAFLGENTPTDYYPWYQLPPVNAAIDGVTLARSCWWGIPNSDGAFSLLVAEIDPATRASIEAALDAEGFSSTVMGTLTAREAEREGEFQYEAETHLFTGNVWILSDDGSLSVSGIVAGSALDALRTANPTMGL